MIVLSGSSGGIGKQIVDHLLQFDDVLAIYNKTFPEVDQKEKLTFEQLNIEDAGKVKAFAERWGTKLSKITLVHLAAAKVDELTSNYKEPDWDHIMSVNLKGNFLLTQSFLPYMIRGRWGRIIHVSSKGAIEGDPGTIAYSTSKTGLLGMSRVLAKEHARFNITSNVLVLGTFETGMFKTLRDDIKKKILNKIPSRTFGQVSNIANAIEFIIKSEYVNGSVINIDGAM